MKNLCSMLVTGINYPFQALLISTPLQRVTDDNIAFLETFYLAHGLSSSSYGYMSVTNELTDSAGTVDFNDIADRLDRPLERG